MLLATLHLVVDLEWRTLGAEVLGFQILHLRITDTQEQDQLGQVPRHLLVCHQAEVQIRRLEDSVLRV